MAAILSKVLSRSVTYYELRFEEDKDAMIHDGLPKEVAEMNTQAFSMIADGDAGWLSEDVPSLLGHPARSFKEFATNYAAIFS